MAGMVSPVRASARFSTKCQSWYGCPIWRSAAISLRVARTLGTSVAESSTTSVANSSAARAFSSRPDAVSMTTYRNDLMSSSSTRSTCAVVRSSASFGVPGAQSTYRFPGCTVRNVLSDDASRESSERAASAKLRSGCRPSALATSPNCRSRSMITTSPGATSARASARLVDTVVLPAPPLGQSEITTRQSLSPSSATSLLSSESRRLSALSNARSNAARSSGAAASGAMTSRAPARSAECRSPVDGLATISTLMSGRSCSNVRTNSRAASFGTSGPSATTSTPLLAM